ncbi:MAG: hypothetical protein JNM78_09015 [Cyclobacteriaceae bacterium]|nr:hypothetical protein [Cyclobacteriaceae bacterium]
MRNLLLITLLFLVTKISYSQDRFKGTHSPDSALLILIKAYSESFDDNKTIAERDAKRKTLVSTAYFYHGIDGAPIGLEGLTKRQTNNNFNVFADSVYDEVLYQYENTAVLMFKEWQHLTDKGVVKESLNSVLILLGKENGKWKVLADIIGREPKSPVKKSK